MKKLALAAILFCSSLQAANVTLVQNMYDQNWAEAKFMIATLLTSGVKEERIEGLIAAVYVSYMLGLEKDVYRYLGEIREMLGDDVHGSLTR